MSTLYDLLSVPRDASPAQIEAAYRRLSFELGPERPENFNNPDAEVRFKAMREAFQILSNPERRDAYDAHLSSKETPIDPADAPRKRGWTPTTILLGVLLSVALVSAVGQFIVQWQAVRASRDFAARAEAHQMEIEKREREQNAGPGDSDALAKREALAQQRADERAEREARHSEERRQRQLESDRRYGDQVSRELHRGEELAERSEAKRLADIERQHTDAANKRKAEDAEALRRLEQEKRKADRWVRDTLK